MDALPEPEQSSTRIDIRQPDTSATTVNKAEAARRYGVSTKTIQRRLDAGDISGAHKTAGRHGDEWRLPIAALEVVFDTNTPTGNETTESTEHDEHVSPADITALVTTVVSLVDTLKDDHAKHQQALETQNTQLIERYDRRLAAKNDTIARLHIRLATIEGRRRKPDVDSNQPSKWVDRIKRITGF